LIPYLYIAINATFNQVIGQKKEGCYTL